MCAAGHRISAKVAQESKPRIGGANQKAIQLTDTLIIKLTTLFNVSADYLLCNTNIPSIELVIPDELKDAKIAFQRGEFGDLTQYEVDGLVEFAKFIKTQRNENNGEKDK